MKKIYIVIMLLMLWMPCKANQIDIMAKTTTPREGARMPSALRIEASCNAETVTINIHNYNGVFVVYIYDVSGNILLTEQAEIASHGTIAIDVSCCPQGDYTLAVSLNDNIYEGKLHIEKVA